jgi:hypothetical protein
MGTPINSLDAGCQSHDNCYANNGLTVGSNFGLSHNSALQGCNQALCNAAQSVQSQIMAKVTAARNAFIARGGNIAANPSFTSPAEDSEYSAAGQIIGYFTIAPIIGNNGCH